MCINTVLFDILDGEVYTQVLKKANYMHKYLRSAVPVMTGSYISVEKANYMYWHTVFDMFR
jgi:hypothetical protein